MTTKEKSARSTIPLNECPDPIAKDIYVEVDWMKRDEWVYFPMLKGYLHFVCDHKMSPEAKSKVVKAFRTHEITLHIDDGCMGGGRPIPHEDPITGDPNVLSSPWEEKFQDEDAGYFNPDRLHIFRYCVFAHRILDNSETDHSGISGGDSFTVAHDVVNSMGSTAVAGTFMHELGHTLGLGFDEGINHGEGCPSGYKSCMNYDYQLTLVDYHDGSGGYYDDWGNLDFDI